MLMRFWRGEANLWLTLLVFSLVLPLLGVTLLAPAFLSGDIMQEHPMRRIGSAAIFLTIIGLLGMFQLVAVWRATKADGRGWLARWLSRSAALLVAGGAGLVALMVLPGVSAMLAAANDQDEIGRKGYAIRVERNTLVIQGYLTWKLLDDVRDRLARLSAIDTVLLESPGGHVGVGSKLADVLNTRGVTTLVTGTCASACTLAFVGGRARVLRRGGRLGFHGVAGDGTTAITSGTQRFKLHFQRYGVAKDFIDRASAVSPASIWFPTHDELSRAGVLTRR